MAETNSATHSTVTFYFILTVVILLGYFTLIGIEITKVKRLVESQSPCVQSTEATR